MTFTFLFLKLWFLLLVKEMLYFNMYSDAPFFFVVNRYGTALVMKVLLLYSLFHKAGYFYVSRGCGLSNVFNSQQYLRKFSNKIQSAL